MKIDDIIIKASRIYHTDCGVYLRLIESQGDPPFWYIQDFDGNWVSVADEQIQRLEEAEYEYDLRIKKT